MLEEKSCINNTVLFFPTSTISLSDLKQFFSDAYVNYLSYATQGSYEAYLGAEVFKFL